MGVGRRCRRGGRRGGRGFSVYSNESMFFSFGRVEDRL